MGEKCYDKRFEIASYHIWKKLDKKMLTRIEKYLNVLPDFYMYEMGDL